MPDSDAPIHAFHLLRRRSFMKALPTILTGLLGTMLLCPSASAGPYEDCILNNVKDARTPVAVAAIRMACREKTTPIGCRNLVTPSLDEFLEKARPDNPGVSDTDLSGYWLEEYSSKRKSEFRKCVSDCEASSWWERTFGDCKFC